MPLSRIHNDSLSDHIILDGTDSTGANANSKLLLDASAVDTDVNAAISYEINSNDAARQSFETIQVNNLKKRDGRNFVYSNRNKIINNRDKKVRNLENKVDELERKINRLLSGGRSRRIS